MKLTSTLVEYSKLVCQEQLRKALRFVSTFLLAVSDYKRLDTSFHFIITNFKPLLYNPKKDFSADQRNCKERILLQFSVEAD